MYRKTVLLTLFVVSIVFDLILIYGFTKEKHMMKMMILMMAISFMSLMYRCR